MLKAVKMNTDVATVRPLLTTSDWESVLLRTLELEGRPDTKILTFVYLQTYGHFCSYFCF